MGNLHNRLRNKAHNLKDCHIIIKTQDHLTYVYDNNTHSDQIEEIKSFSIWSCINCTYQNNASSLKCQICNTPNYSINIKPDNNASNEQHNNVSLADYLHQNKYDKIMYDDDNDDLLQIAIQLSCQQQNITSRYSSNKTLRKYPNNGKNMNRSSFRSYWTELQGNKLQKKLYTRSCIRHMRETKLVKSYPSNDTINNIFNQLLVASPLQTPTLTQYLFMKSLIPSIRQLESKFCTLFPAANFKIRNILSSYSLHRFFYYGCHKNSNNVRLVYTDKIFKSYDIWENPKVLSNIPDQELIIYGIIREYFPDLLGVPDDLIKMISCFFNIDTQQEWKFNIRNAPSDAVVICHPDLLSIDDGYKTRDGSIFICLITSKKKKLECENNTINIIRNANILPIYSIDWKGYLGIMKRSTSHYRNPYYYGGNKYGYSWGGYRFSRHMSNAKIYQFKAKLEPLNTMKGSKKRKIERKWSAYHKILSY